MLHNVPPWSTGPPREESLPRTITEGIGRGRAMELWHFVQAYNLPKDLQLDLQFQDVAGPHALAFLTSEEIHGKEEDGGLGIKVKWRGILRWAMNLWRNGLDAGGAKPDDSYPPRKSPGMFADEEPTNRSSPAVSTSSRSV